MFAILKRVGGSSNGRTTAFGAVYPGSNPGPRTSSERPDEAARSCPGPRARAQHVLSLLRCLTPKGQSDAG